MDTRIALIGIIVEEPSAADRINAVLHEYAPYIVGRMGIPYRQKEVCIISVVIDAPRQIRICVRKPAGRRLDSRSAPMTHPQNIARSIRMSRE